MPVTSECVHPRSRVHPVHAPEVGRAHSHSGQRWFELGRCTQHVAPHPCTERAKNHFDYTYFRIMPSLEEMSDKETHVKKGERVNARTLRKKLEPGL